MSERSVIVASQVKTFAKGHEVLVSSEFVEALEKNVRESLSQAVSRAKANKRKTLRPEDI